MIIHAMHILVIVVISVPIISSRTENHTESSILVNIITTVAPLIPSDVEVKGQYHQPQKAHEIMRHNSRTSVYMQTAQENKSFVSHLCTYTCFNISKFDVIFPSNCDKTVSPTM